MATIKFFNLLLLALVTEIYVRAFKLKHTYILKPKTLQCSTGESNNVAHSRGLLSGIQHID